MLTETQKRFTVRYWAVAGSVLLAGWLVSRFVVPVVIASAYAGRSIGVLNRIITGQATLTVDDYVTAWFAVANTLLLAGGGLAVAGYAVILWRAPLGALLRRTLLEPDPPRVAPSRLFYAGLLTGLVAGLLEVLAIVLDVSVHMGAYSSEALWMTPAAGALVFGGLGAVLALCRSRSAFPKFETAMVLFVSLAVHGVFRPVFPSVHPWATAVLSLGIGIQVTRLVTRRLASVDTRLPRVTAAVAMLVVVLGVAHHGLAWLGERRALAALPEARDGAPNVLLIVLDVVRAKNMSLHGYHRPTTPAIDAFAESAVVFDRAYAPTSWTLPSHGTFFTGRWPTELGIPDLTTPLDDTHPTLASVLASHGYQTAGFVANYYYTTSTHGLDRGFVRYEDEPVSWQMLVHNSWRTRMMQYVIQNAVGQRADVYRKLAGQVTADFLSWRSRAPDRPYFAFLNYIDAHAPYRPPPPFRNMFVEGDPQYWHAPGETAEGLESAYDAAIAYVDHEVGVLLQGLEARGDLENTIVIVTSDHGEEFGEHGTMGHRFNVYVPTLHVPLVIRLPGGVWGGVRVPAAVSLRDIPATVVDLLGLADAAPFPGVSLRARWDPERVAAEGDAVSPVFASLIRSPNWRNPVHPSDFGWLRSVIVGDWHYILWQDGREELFDLAEDPDEANDLSESHGAELAELREALIVYPVGPSDRSR